MDTRTALIAFVLLLQGVLASYKHCETSADCTHLPNGVCENHACVVQQACRTGAECSNITKAICDGRQCMVCLYGAIPSASRNKCTFRGQCVDRFDCLHVEGAICDAQSLRCACPYRYRPSHDGTSCLKGSECKDSNDCKHAQHSHCRDGHCRCSEGAIESDDRATCLLMSTAPGSACESHRQCTAAWGPGAACRKGHCSCRDEYLFTDTCTRIVDRVGDSCNAETEVCYLRDNAAQQRVFCEGGKCQCYEKHSASADRGACLYNCESANDCRHISNATCTDGQCTCPAEHVLNTGNNKCLPISTKLGSPCQDARQCSKKWGVGGVCNSTKCACDMQYSYDGYSCVYNTGSERSSGAARSLSFICIALTFGRSLL